MTCRWIALGVTAAAVFGCNAEPALLRQIRKERLINDIRHALLASVEAEKSAVLLTTDEEEQSLAHETRRFARDINQKRAELRSLIITDALGDELAKLDAFDSAWAALEDVDQRLLALAEADTNLKAARLSAHEGAATLDRFVDTLTELQQTATDPETMRALSQASVAALRVNSLVMVHIPSPDDAEMTRLEQRIEALSTEVESRLARARDSGELSPEQLAIASQTWSEYRRLVVEVLRLSRENTNVISFDVSVHEKRHATKHCLDALAALMDVVRTDSRATR